MTEKNELAKRLIAECQADIAGLESINLPAHDPTIAIEELLSGYLPDDREDHWEAIQAYADIHARRAVLLNAPAQQSERPTDAMLDAMRKAGLSIDGDNAYKRDLLDTVVGAMLFGFQNTNPPPEGHWGKEFWDIGRAEGEAQEQLIAKLQEQTEPAPDHVEDVRALVKPAPAQEQDEQRGAFESWLRPNWSRAKRIDEDGDLQYVEDWVQGAWIGWQATCPAQTAPRGTTSDKYRAELYDEVWEKARGMGYGNVTNALAELERMKAAPQPEQRELPPFVKKIIAKLRRFEECTSDSQGADIGRHWFDVLTQLGLLNRVQRSPALWEMSQQGEDALAALSTQGGSHE